MLGTHLIPVIESSDMRGARAGDFPASSNRGDRRRRREVRSGSADREGHGRPLRGPTTSALRRPGSQRFDPLRGAAVMRRAYATLIALAVAIIAFHEFSSSFTSVSKIRLAAMLAAVS